MREKLIEFFGAIIAALVLIGAVYLGQRMMRMRKKPPTVSKASDLSEMERNRLGGVFRRRRTVAIALFLGPILVTAGDLAWGERLIVWKIGNFPVLILAVLGSWCLGIVYTAIFVRCPLCHTVPLGWMNEIESSYSGRPRGNKGLALFAEKCDSCGLRFRQ